MYVTITAVLIAVISYLLGSVNSAVIISKTLFKKDVREEGSGNAGATNMLRSHGKAAGAATLICDILKGIVAILIARGMFAFLFLFAKNIGTEQMTLFGQSVSAFEYQYIYGSRALIAGLFVVIGHNYPIFFSFKGGKGVATGLGVMMLLNWKVGLIVLVFALLIMICTRYVSVGSLAAAALYIVVDVTYMVATETFFIPELIFVLCMSGLLVWRHKANIKRLCQGTENKMGSKK